MTINRNCLTKADAVVIAAIEAGVPSLIEARALVDQFHDMIRKKDEAKLDLWIANAKRSLVSSFATGVLKDRAAVRAAIIQPWSNGQVEAQITKLKLVNDKCTAARKSTFWKHDCWGLRDPRRRHLICVRPQTACRCTTIGIAIRLPLFLIGMGQEKDRTCRRHWNRGVVHCLNCGAGH
jgi:hypothetical protein